MTKFSSLAFWLIIPWSASKTIRIVSFRNNVRSNLLLFSPWKFSRAFSRISQIIIRSQIQYELLEIEPQMKLLTQEKPSISVRSLVIDTKLGCVVRMVVDSMLPHAEGGPNDHRKDAPPFNIFSTIWKDVLFQSRLFWLQLSALFGIVDKMGNKMAKRKLHQHKTSKLLNL